MRKTSDTSKIKRGDIMKKVSKYLILAALSMILLFAGCSVSMGFPWLAGGWGGIIDFGFTGYTNSTRASSENFTMNMEQKESCLNGIMSLNGNEYEFTGSVNKQGMVSIEFVLGNEKVKLEGIYADGKLMGNNEIWSAQRIAAK